MNHSKYMNRCFELAVHGEGLTGSNPLVGCVIAAEGRIIGEGYHNSFGGLHAEVVAIGNVSERNLLPDATLYVNLEPCSHHGKTPPCTDLIISRNIKQVVVGALDSNPSVAGRGIQKLRDAGIEVITGIEVASSRWLNRHFFSFHERKRPWVILKWAQTEDGFIDMHRKHHESPSINWITDPKLRILVHRWRGFTDAVLVGAGTIKNDNPELTTRFWPGRNPLRIVIDTDSELDAGFRVFDNSAETWLYSGQPKMFNDTTIFLGLPENISDLPVRILNDLYNKGLQSLTIEGGRKTLDLFIKSGLWDEARIFTGSVKFGIGLQSPEIEGEDIALFQPGRDNLRICINPNPYRE